MKISTLGAIALVSVSMSGCVVAPVGPTYAPPPGEVYVAPTYESPGVGYVWEFHPRFGWGWHHPQYGWHRGWQ
jgi:hypothetical protein